MKLSEAIRLGSMATEQQFGWCGDLESGKTCALGAVFVAVGENYTYEDMKAKLPLLAFTESAPCPQCGRCGDSSFATIPHLNDHHRWTREQIADWVETIERAQEQPDPSCVSIGVRTEQETAATAVAHSAPK